MTALRYALSQQVFLVNDEKLVDFVSVTKANKKVKVLQNFLCIAVMKERPMSVTICHVKKSDNKSSDKVTYKKKETWRLSDLQKADGKYSSKDSPEFDLHFDRVYKWIASSAQDKNKFINWLYNLSTRNRYKASFPEFPKELFEDNLLIRNVDITMKAMGEDAVIEAEDYQALTEREESDLEKLMSQCEFAVSNAEAFTEQLSRDLSLLDGANIHTIMASEDQVQNLMEMIQNAVDEATKIEASLDGYDEILKNIRETMETIEDKNISIQVQNANSLKLYEELNQVVQDLDLDHTYKCALLEGDLTHSVKVRECTEAARALLKATNVQLHPCWRNMAAIDEQLKRLDKIRAKFTHHLTRHLNNLFIHMSNTLEGLPRFQILNSHRGCHRELKPYVDLMLWLKTSDHGVYTQLAKLYQDTFRKTYELGFRELFEKTREKVGRSSQEATGKSSGKSRLSSLLGADKEMLGSELDLVERHKFDKILDELLCELEPVCLAEQQFCVQFFHIASDVSFSSAPQTPSSSNQLALPTGNLVRTPSEEFLMASQKKEKQINDELRNMMGALFFNLSRELNDFIDLFYKLDSFHSMYLLVRLSQHVMSSQDTGSFVSMTFANSLVLVKRKFDSFMSAQMKSVEETKVPKKSRCGILPFVLNFEEFAQHAGAIFHGSERKNYLDKWYVQLVGAMFDAIPRIAKEQSKTPKEVVMMENFHHLYALLSQLKISCLDGVRREAKQKYNEHLQGYVTEYFGRPLEKLNMFFEGVQVKVGQGVKEEEIGYQLAFSKQELRKVIKEYPSKEVKKGLESLYRKVEKHLTEEENLLQVVWHSMQEEFIRQYKYIQNSIERCYPGSMIHLEFSIDDILQFFSDIARSH